MISDPEIESEGDEILLLGSEAAVVVAGLLTVPPGLLPSSKAWPDPPIVPEFVKLLVASR
jgi:hypothetical protein